MSKGYYPCGEQLDWDFCRCPSHDLRCGSCPRRPVAVDAETGELVTDVEIVTGGALRLTRSTVQALAHALGLGRSRVTPQVARDAGVRQSERTLSEGDVTRILAKWVEIKWGGTGSADVQTRSHEEPGWKLWVLTCEAKVWRDASEYVLIPGSTDLQWPAVALVAALRTYELPHLEFAAEQAERMMRLSGRDDRAGCAERTRVKEAETEAQRLERTPQFRRAMRRLVVEFGACDWAFLRVALERVPQHRAAGTRTEGGAR